MSHRYRWRGTNAQRIKVHGSIAAATLLHAKALLRSQGIVPQRVTKEYALVKWQWHQRINALDLALMLRQLATMLQAGVPLLQTLALLAEGQHKLKLQTVLQQLNYSVAMGHTFTEALRQHPRYFQALLCHLIAVGEQTGTLDTLLAKLALHQEKVVHLKSNLKKALYYPAAVVSIAILVTSALLIFVVPQFVALFDAVGATLPWLTRSVMQLSAAFKHYSWLALLLGGVLSYSYRYGLAHLPRLRYLHDQGSLKLPIIGIVLQQAAIARIMRTLAISVAAGLPLLEAITIVSGVGGSVVFSRHLTTVRDTISAGLPLHLALQQTQLFPAMVVQMVAIGETSGTLDTMLHNMADFYEQELDNKVAGLSSLIEPIIMSLLGIIIGGLVIAMYLPIFKLGAVF